MGVVVDRGPYTVSVVIYLISLLVLYIASTMYHATFAMGDAVTVASPFRGPRTPPWPALHHPSPSVHVPHPRSHPFSQTIFTLLDHSAIYLLIAG